MGKKMNGRNAPTENGKAKEKRLEQKLFRLMPALPRLLRRVGQRIENIDWRQPKTFKAKMEGDFKAFEQTLKGRERRVGRLLWFLLGKAAMQIQAKRIADEMIPHLKKLAAEDARYSLLLKLMHEADKQVSFASLTVFRWHGDPEAAWMTQCAPLDLLEQAAQQRGEARAKTVLRAFFETAEYLYKPYLWTLWYLSYVREGKVPPQAPDFGELVKQTHRRLRDYAGLVEPDAGWMRNSAAHNMPEYVLGEDSVVMWDRTHEPTKVRVDDLLEMTMRMYTISGVTISRVAQLYFMRDFFVNTGLFDKFVGLVPAFFSRHEARMTAAEQEFENHAKTLTAPMVAFFNPKVEE